MAPGFLWSSDEAKIKGGGDVLYDRVTLNLLVYFVIKNFFRRGNIDRKQFDRGDTNKEQLS